MVGSSAVNQAKLYSVATIVAMTQFLPADVADFQAVHEEVRIVLEECWSDEAVRRVRDELRRLGASDDDCVISSDLKLRLDGLPRSDQGQPRDPGVAVYWRKRAGETTKVMAIE